MPAGRRHTHTHTLHRRHNDGCTPDHMAEGSTLTHTLRTLARPDGRSALNRTVRLSIVTVLSL